MWEIGNEIIGENSAGVIYSFAASDNNIRSEYIYKKPFLDFLTAVL